MVEPATVATSRVVSQDIPVNRDLLNPKFEGYKLSLEEIKVETAKLPGNSVWEVKLNDEQLSYQQVRAFYQVNSLTGDPWNRSAVYWINKDLEICGFCQETDLRGTSFVIAQIPKRDLDTNVTQDFQVGLHFCDSLHAIVADGSGRLYIAHRTSKPQDKWTLQAIDYVGSKTTLLVTAISWKDKSEEVFEVVLLSVEERVSEAAENSRQRLLHKEHQAVLEWLTVKRDMENMTWVLDRTRLLHGKTVPNTVTIDSQGKGLSICGESPFTFVSDTAKVVVVDSNEEMDESIPEVTDSVNPDYTWLQSANDVTVRFPSPLGLTQQQLSYQLTPSTIKLVHDSGKVLLDGELPNQVDPDASKWTIENSAINLVLRKRLPERWLELVVGDTRGRETFSVEDLSEVADRFSGMSSDKWVTPQDVNMSNPDQLEECDYSDEAACWIRLDGESHEITHKVDISSNQYLFSALLDDDELPAVCLRHDVDGVLVKPCAPKTTADSAVFHVGTFNALGYVMASKRDKRFASCSPSMSFAALCDGDRNIYIYRSDVPVESVLLNRKTGKVVKTVAKQHVLTLDKPGSILGFYVNDTSIFVLKPDVLLLATL